MNPMKHLPVLALLLAAPLAYSQNHLGRWVTESGNLEVQLEPCGDALCGKVVKVLANRSMSGPGAMEPADTRSPLGMTILSDLKPSGEGEWTGQIYNRENAKHYSVRMSTTTADQLVLRAYVGLPLFGKTQVWRRAEAAQ
jgi:uncharacterized protein (DUF2147 family)